MQPLDVEEPLDSLDSFSEKLWAKVPELIRKDVEQHVVAHLPDNLLTKLRDLHARGIPISSDDAFFHFGGGMAVRNLCRERLIPRLIDQNSCAHWRNPMDMML
jgi:hypothetical protein